jgi:Arylsulfotransferase (ASST)
MDSLVSNTFNFSYQHHARFIPGGIRFFDNANSEASESNETHLVPTSSTSSGMEVQLDEENLKATLVKQVFPPTGVLDHSQGSHQVLPNGNHFCGLGSINEVFERSPSGTVALSASIGQKPIGSYRAFKRPWTGLPLASEFALFTYAHNTSTSNIYYVSWNGATNVQKYEFFTSNSSTGPFTSAATITKDFHFETQANGSSFGLYSYAQAIDNLGTVLGRTSVMKTFVPANDIAKTCSHLQCAPYTDYQAAPRAIGPTIQFKYVNVR